MRFKQPALPSVDPLLAWTKPAGAQAARSICKLGCLGRRAVGLEILGRHDGSGERSAVRRRKDEGEEDKQIQNPGLGIQLHLLAGSHNVRQLELG